ncbi:MAG: chromosomal replication initiator protein DnaA [Caldilineales bacterium]|nr:chromosomal replication initiator protein DnaA [Caldilineales bacterium]
MAPENIWQAVLGELQLALPRHVFETWLRDTALIAYEDGCFFIATPTAFAQSMLEDRLKGMIKQRLTRISRRTVDVRFVVRPDVVTDPENAALPPLLDPTPESPARFHHAPATPPSLNPAMTFATFIEGEGNRFAHAAAQAVAQQPGDRYNPLFIYGGVGLGKTHLLHAVGNQAAQQGLNVRYVTSEAFTNDLIEAIRTKANVTFRQTYREVDILLIDDIQFIEGKDSTQNEVFHTFNALYAANKQIIIASDRPPQQLTKLEDRLRSRFTGGLSVDLHPPDLEHRIAILRAKALEIGALPPADVMRYIAEHYSDNVRELQGALTRVTAFARHHALPPTLELAQRILGEPEVPCRRDPQAILDAVADVFRITPAELGGPRRSRRVVEPRQVAMYLLREIAQLSFPQIGEYLGGRDHTTAMYGHDKMRRQLQEDAHLRGRVEQVQIALRL